MNNTAKTSGQYARDLAQKIAKQIAKGPLEVLKTANEQVFNPENIPLNENPQVSQSGDLEQKKIEEQQITQDKIRTSRGMEALKSELSDIEKQDLFKNLQEKITQGEEIPLEDYPTLSIEQKQVLKAQTEAVKYQKDQAAYNESKGALPFVSSKPNRRFGAGRSQKAEAERQQTRVEKPVPPSG
ncbi:MAG: hypothetical protein ABSC49_03800 [Candidatus Microgenomates bacterium]|jgi:hypothetical protein